MYRLYELLWLVAAPLVVVSRVLRLGRLGPLGLRERCGILPPTLLRETAGSRPIWIHAASLGEAGAAMAMIQALARRMPGRPVVLSTMTVTGRRLADQAVGPRAFYLPMDLGVVMRRVMARLEPSLLLLVETELWPNMIRMAARAGVPVIVISGRISPEAYRWSRLVRPFWVRVFSHVTRFLMQSEADADRIVALGADPRRVTVCGDIKSAVTVLPPSADLVEALVGSPVVVAGSVHPGEVAVLLEAYRALRGRGLSCRLVVAPRHLETTGEVEQACRAAGIATVRRTALSTRSGERHRLGEAVVLLDTHGELAGLYSLATVAFVGGTLVPVGGHNLLEPARAARPVLFGPYCDHVTSHAQALVSQGGGICVRGAEELTSQLEELLNDGERCKAMGERARRVVEAQEGALDRTLAALTPYLA